MDPMEAIKQGFFQECEELLLAMEEGLIALEGGDADPETINAVFRAVHSIKGGAGAFGFDTLVGFAHKFETVLDQIRSGTLACESDVVKVLLRAGDLLADHFAAARGGTPAPSDGDVVDDLEMLAGGLADGDAGEEPEEFASLGFQPIKFDIEEGPPPVVGWTIRFAPRAALYAKANDPYLLIRELCALGPAEVEADLSALPPLDAIEPDQAYVAWTVALNAGVDRAKIDEVFEFACDDCDLDIVAIEGGTEPTMAELPDIAPDFEPVPQEKQVEAKAEAKKDAAAAPADAPKQTIRVDLDKVDRLVNLVGELVITQAMLSQRVAEADIAKNASIGNGLAELEHLLRDLQEGVMAIRTQPVKSVFQRMPRLVRELSAQTNKQVHLVVEGEGTEVDKTVIERLGEPLTHMIRNAVDHGLETPEDRAKAGKASEGTVTLSAAHRGGRIVIEVSDNGRGIDRARVRAKAEEKGLIPTSAVLSDDEVDNLIFLPGFSTAAQVSNISGRGVGMDVVRRSIVDLGGRIVISSNPGQGSRFSLTLPLTLAVLDGMVVAVGSQTFVLPLTHIIESLKPRVADIQAFGRDRTLLKVRESYVPLVDVGQLLGVADAGRDVAGGVVILVESEGCGRLALAVDRILGQRQVVIKSFEQNYRRIEGIAAATILGDGRVALILDVDGIVNRCRTRLTDAPTLPATGTGP
jgi:two-component system, chemotaxis family, sensor kinase CheA